MNRRAFIKGLGAFMILPGAGRIWKAAADTRIHYRANGLRAFWWQTSRGFYYMTEEYRAALEASINRDNAAFFNMFFHGHRIDGSVPPPPPPRPGYREWDVEMEQRL